MASCKKNHQFVWDFFLEYGRIEWERFNAPLRISVKPRMWLIMTSLRSLTLFGVGVIASRSNLVVTWEMDYNIRACISFF